MIKKSYRSLSETNLTFKSEITKNFNIFIQSLFVNAVLLDANMYIGLVV